MRQDIQPNERSFSTKEVAEQLGIATPTVRKYGQILERNGYEFLKEGDRRIFVQSDIDALMAIRDTDKPLQEQAIDLVHQQQERLEAYKETGVSVPDTYEHALQDPGQVKDFLRFLAKELEASRQMNAELQASMSQLKTTVSQLQQDHHAISSGIGNSAKKTQSKIEKLTEQQKSHYEEMLQKERQQKEWLQKELHMLRTEQKNEWRSQNDFNQRLELTIKERKSFLEKVFSFFGK